ncbi:MAG TPA: HesA/MoeB/ThiF family protein [Desulfobacterales bacterium]|nr:HesA/MoeB/ThiF family protein [Desulfobacterales bacterium]
MKIARSELEQLAEVKTFPDQTPYKSLSVHHVLELSRRPGPSGREIEISALENGIVPERYARNMRTFSLEEQAALLQARVGVVGLGGLGGTVAEVLARMGVGHLRLVDGDRFEESNLNRQLLSTVESLGQLKSEAARERVGRINPSVDINALAEFVTAENAGAVIEGCNVVVDCLDNLRTRFVVEDACRRIGCPLVSAAVAGASGHVTTIFPEDTGLRLIYGEPGQLPLKGAETALGTLPHAVVFLATLECAEVVKVILKKGSLLRHKLLVADLMDGIVEVMNLR